MSGNDSQLRELQRWIQRAQPIVGQNSADDPFRGMTVVVEKIAKAADSLGIIRPIRLKMGSPIAFFSSKLYLHDPHGNGYSGHFIQNPAITDDPDELTQQSETISQQKATALQALCSAIKWWNEEISDWIENGIPDDIEMLMVENYGDLPYTPGEYSL